MRTATNIKYIVIHCTAGHSSAEKVQDYFLRSKAKGGRGWNTGGYHKIIEKDGEIIQMYDWGTITNGVGGFNSESVHISYVGGVDPKDAHKAVDTRTNEQRAAIVKCIVEAIIWLKANGKDVTKDLMILGHYDFSDDKNQNGAIDSNERIKECPSFDARKEYNPFFGASNSIQILPKNR